MTKKYNDEGGYGPAYKALPTDRQRMFVMECVEPTPNGEINYTQAARRAGFTGDPSTLKVTAHRLAHDTRVQAAMLEEATRRLGAAMPLATATLIQIMSTSPKEQTRLKAAAMVLDRGGMAVKTQHEVKVVHELTTEEKIARAIQLAKENGLDPRALLGQAGITIDADFKVVEPDVDLEAFLA